LPIDRHPHPLHAWYGFDSRHLPRHETPGQRLTLDPLASAPAMARRGRVINDGPGSDPAVMCPTAPKQVSEGSETTLQAGVKQPIQAAMVPAGAVKQYLRERRPWLAAARRLAAVRPRQGKRQPVSGRSQAARALDGRSGTACFEPHLRSVAVSLR